MTYPVSILLFVFGCLLVQGSTQPKKVIFLHESSEKTIGIMSLTTDDGEIRKEGCAIIPNMATINKNLASNSMQIYKVPDDEMQSLLQDCFTYDHQRRKRDTDNATSPVDLSSEFSAANDTHEGTIIFPGTKWCGAGDRAKDYNDLGTSEGTDKCCRDHDYCNDTIAPGETKYNLTNNTPYTVLSCECDDTFHQCLHDDGSTTSTLVGWGYFDFVGNECFAYDYPPSEKCKKKGFLGRSCRVYEKDTTQAKSYRFSPAEPF